MNSESRDYTDDQMLRRKAEEQLKLKQKKSDPILESDATKLLHELQVHQIELEMQNEELQRANETAETALRKYTLLYDFAPAGFFTLHSNGTICDLNFTAAEMLRDKRISLVNNDIRLYLTEDSKTEFNAFFKKVYSEKRKETCKLILGNEEGPYCQVYVEGIVTGEEQKCLLSVVDTSGFN
ncbi:MAG: hypothetical protein A2X22_06145 [Bacteroidetes bacterium GWF2_49_14]|nr:MAG: hypothetical protein A2X22_06145 [Bacteroidetes bacterium GWF2_49_14]